MIASEIGTSIPSRPTRSDAHALRKNGCPAKATVGSAIIADIQWNKVRVASSAPDQTATDSSMTFIIAKPDTPSRSSRSRPCASLSPDDRASLSSSCASWPIRASAVIRVSASMPGAAWTVARLRVRFTRAADTPGRAISADSMAVMQAAQWIWGRDRISRCASSSGVRAAAIAMGATAQAGQAISPGVWI